LASGPKSECLENFSEYIALFHAFAPDGQELPPAQWPVSRALRGETVAGYELGVRRRDTGENWLGSYSFAPIRNGDGAIVEAIVTARDITAQRRVAVELHDHQRRLKAIFETSMEGIITIDSKGIIQAGNPAAAEMYGYGINEMLGVNVNMLMPGPVRARHDSLIAKYLRAGDKTVIGRPRKLEGLRKNSEIFPSQITITDASDSRDMLFIGFIRDLSQIENEKLKTEDAQTELLHVARLSDMREAAAGLAHEVSQLLTAGDTNPCVYCPPRAVAHYGALHCACVRGHRDAGQKRHQHIETPSRLHRKA
jgi:PAS domain S-box-containing protein